MPVAVVTGANTGIGLSLCERLLAIFQDDGQFRLCLACRNKGRAETARTALLSQYQCANIDIILIDMCDVSSVYVAAVNMQHKYRNIDYLFFNAGIMGKTRFDAAAFLRKIISPEFFSVLTTGRGVLSQEDSRTKDGLQAIFSTNIFSHFVLLSALLELNVIGSGEKTGDCETRIIWNSSLNASKQAFSINDIQHAHGNEPYSSSKYATDQLSYVLNEKYNATQQIYSSVTSPGTVVTQITQGILPAWVWVAMKPLLYMMRVLVPSLTYTPYNGAEAMCWVLQQDATTTKAAADSALSPDHKYHSETSVLGHNYVRPEQVDIHPSEAESLYAQLCALERRFRPAGFGKDES